MLIRTIVLLCNKGIGKEVLDEEIRVFNADFITLVPFKDRLKNINYCYANIY